MTILTRNGAAKDPGPRRFWLAAYVSACLVRFSSLRPPSASKARRAMSRCNFVEALGVLERGRVAQDVKSLDQNARGALRKLGVRFGAYYIYMPNLVKPAIRVLATQLWALRQARRGLAAGLDEIPAACRLGPHVLSRRRGDPQGDLSGRGLSAVRRPRRARRHRRAAGRSHSSRGRLPARRRARDRRRPAAPMATGLWSPAR